MQSYEDSKLIQSMQGTLKELTEKMPANATHHVIGLFPNRGKEVEINGLMWYVEQANEQAGWIRLRLKTP